MLAGRPPGKAPGWEPLAWLQTATLRRMWLLSESEGIVQDFLVSI